MSLRAKAILMSIFRVSRLINGATPIQVQRSLFEKYQPLSL